MVAEVSAGRLRVEKAGEVWKALEILGHLEEHLQVQIASLNASPWFAGFLANEHDLKPS